MVLAIWVGAFVTAVYLEIPFAALGVLPVLSVLVAAACFGRGWLHRLRSTSRSGLRWAGKILAFGCVLGLLVLVTSRPDADDVGYLHPILMDSTEPTNPVERDPFVFYFRGERVVIPFLSENEAYEALVVVTAGLVGLDPLVAYHNIFAFVAVLLWTVLYALLLRRFRIPRSKVWLGLLIIVGFLLLDGNLHRSFGNFSLLRIWQGKVIAFAILGPAFLFFLLRLMARMTWYRLTVVLALAGSSFFVNRSSLFFMVLAGLAVPMARWLALGRRKDRRKLLAVAGIVAPLLIVGGLILLQLLRDLPASSSPWSLWQAPGDHQQTVESKDYGLTWHGAMYELMIGSPAALLRDALFLFLVPWLTVPKPLRRFLPVYSGLIVALSMAPWSGPVWHHLTTVAYWRLYLALPLPLCVGLSSRLLVSPVTDRTVARFRWVAAVLVLGVSVSAFERATLSASNGVSFKKPFSYRLPEEELAFARQAEPLLEGRRVLAPNVVSQVLALTAYDTVQLASTRIAGGTASSTKGRASWLLGRCAINQRLSSILEELILAEGIDAIVIARCSDKRVRRLQNQMTSVLLEQEPDVATDSHRLLWVRGQSSE